MEIKELISHPIGKTDITALVHNIKQDGIDELYLLLFDSDKRTSDNAAWVMTHLPLSDREILEKKKNELIDEALTTSSVTKQRLLLRLLDDVEISEEDVRTDFLDFCLNGITNPNLTYGVRSLCMKLSFKQCRHWPELLAELRSTIELLEPHTLPSSLLCLRRNILKDIDTIKASK
ncbi:MAG: hypothetical protein J5848_05720 [Bacteroidales bacterium]|nr:hypothetical protein [Bacteroidales bacterium]